MPLLEDELLEDELLEDELLEDELLSEDDELLSDEELEAGSSSDELLLHWSHSSLPKNGNPECIAGLKATHSLPSQTKKSPSLDEELLEDELPPLEELLEDELELLDELLLPVDELLLPVDELLLPVDELLLPVDELLLPVDELLLLVDELLDELEDELLLPVDELLDELEDGNGQPSQPPAQGPPTTLCLERSSSDIFMQYSKWHYIELVRIFVADQSSPNILTCFSGYSQRV